MAEGPQSFVGWGPLTRVPLNLNYCPPLSLSDVGPLRAHREA